MKSKLTVPKKINVGFQARKDTYTGKLAYVVFTDAKGVLRKADSWNKWRDQKIDPLELDNEPTSGFVLNKKVGGYGGWNPRQTWVRIYDPRDFEFEISVANLLFILEECSAIKGKGLEGEFVYAWDGSELVLLPASSQEYKASCVYTELQTKKVSAKEVKPGFIYLNKDNQEVMYLGRFDWYDIETRYDGGYTRCTGTVKTIRVTKPKIHVFVSVDEKSTYWTQSGFTKLALKIGEEPSPLFADEFEKFKKTLHAAGPAPAKDLLVSEPRKVNLKEAETYCGIQAFQKRDDNFFPIVVKKYQRWDSSQNAYVGQGFELLTATSPVVLKGNKTIFIPDVNYNQREETTIAPENLENLELYSLFVNSKEGGSIAFRNY